jgi:molecular chaperone GrpE (heat shock protein)
MSKKSVVIIGLVLLAGGAGLLAWARNEQNKDAELWHKRQQQRQADLGRVDEVVGDEMAVGTLNGIAYYDEDAQQKESDEYRQREEARGLVVIVAGVLSLTGGTIVCSSLLIAVGRLIVRAKGVLPFSRGSSAQPGGPADEQIQQEDATEDQEKPVPAVKRRRTFRDVREQLKLQAEQENSGLSEDASKRAKTTARANTKASRRSRSARDKKGRFRRAPADGAENSHEVDGPVQATPEIEVLLCDAESVELEGTVDSYSDGPEAESREAGSAPDQQKLADSFRARTEELEEKMTEFKRMAQSVQAKQAAEQARPVEDSIKELTQQMSAIREYATDQQERVKKLQDGYDWNIIRNFCLRVIRCIDNLESRIERLSGAGVETADLEEIRDELVFALESTGVEQFEPELDSEYRGQERNAEAIRHKENCDDPSLSGKIAEVVRPGYHYSIDDENVKIVRTAQVKLYN